MIKEPFAHFISALGSFSMRFFIFQAVITTIRAIGDTFRAVNGY